MSQVYDITKAWLELATNPIIQPSDQLRDTAYPVMTITADRVSINIVDGEGTAHSVLVAHSMQQRPDVYNARVPRFVDMLLRAVGSTAVSHDRATLIEWLRADGFALTVGAVKVGCPLVKGFGESDQFQ